MTKISDKIKALLENPDDLSVLAEVYNETLELEQQKVDYETKLGELQQANRSLLKMIPKVEEPKKMEPEVEKINEAPSVDEGAEALKAIIGGH